MKNIKLIINNLLISRFPKIYLLKSYLKYLIRYKNKFTNQLNNNLTNLNKFNSHHSIFIPLIETSHYQVHQILILAKSLEIRGVKITVLICDSFLKACELKSVKTKNFKNACIKCHFNQKYLIKHYDLNFIKYSTLFSNKELLKIKKLANKIYEKNNFNFLYENQNISPAINDSVNRYYYGGEPENEVERKKIYTEHLNTYILGIESSKKIRKKIDPNIILNNMAVYSSWSPFYDYFRKHDKVNCHTITLTQFNYNSLIVNVDELVLSNKRFLDFKKLRKDKLTTVEFNELSNFINKRKSGDSEIFKDLKFFKKTSKNLLDSLKIDSSKNNIFLFSNIFWDVGQANYSSIYDGIIHWVLDTISILSNDPNSHLYIKLHPGEVFDSAKSIKGMRDYIFERFPKLPRNITLIYPEMKISPYELFPYIDIGVVYNGTIGLEMALDNIPVIITGQSPYGRLNIVNEPTNRDEYTNMLRKNNLIIGKKFEIQLVAYFYFIKTNLPWNLTKSVYNNDFNGFEFDSLSDLSIGKNKYLDHLCNYILNPKTTNIDNW